MSGKRGWGGRGGRGPEHEELSVKTGVVGEKGGGGVWFCQEPLPPVLKRLWSMRLRRAGGAVLHEKIVHRPPHPPPHS